MSFKNYLQSFAQGDWKSGIAVFLVALPLCLGIALASGAPLLAGLIAGIIGGIIVSWISGSQLSVSGPAAGLTIIVANAILDLGSFAGFLLVVILAGIIQVILGLAKMGKLGSFFPSSVIRGMLVAIGIVIILKQIPHAIGDDLDFIGEFEFNQSADGQNTFSELISSLLSINPGALIIALSGLVLLFSWTPLSKKLPLLSQLPASLFVVILGVLINNAYEIWMPEWFLGNSKEHMVGLPLFSNFAEIGQAMVFPDWEFLSNPKIYTLAVTLALVASLESLLSLEATDSLDPAKRISSADRELVAQGVGNIFSGFLGGLPITSVIVRSSTNVYAGGKSKMSGFFHGILLLLAVLLLPQYLNKIPLACLASILLYTGYKLAHPSQFQKVISEGWKQWIPFLITIIVVVMVDLLWGIFVGTIVGIGFVIVTNYSSVFSVFSSQNEILIKFQKDVTFLHKMALKETFRKIPPGSEVYIDTTKVHFMDHDIQLLIQEFINTAHERGIEAEIKKK
ncbi:SulP family inorganic anion transporter [Aquirufa ecclesiirivi]|uniref:SulP family inorganic anion transporter n=1 Tax=Aquirufa ecclesiirivi TaxID=2715124 RepID=A0ABT4JG18_9BACT|nr:SulP family inorganic anion transporter [Aquirufa ecclesiirivi]MCZ2473448.1 SulP family inorganic anion transporter [Aquirufa ecclesiirivi]MCZ2475231.1 SulP family inorganic anion transporter [Aquirufa ecclesiirivi]NHC48265.1 SulP family inorganic anion transporter [Aquirufa ecclesiirivi]